MVWNLLIVKGNKEIYSYLPSPLKSFTSPMSGNQRKVCIADIAGILGNLLYKNI